MDLTEFTNTLQNWIATTGIKIVVALLIWFISFKIINVVTKKILKKVLNSENRKVDKTLAKTLSHAIKIVLKILVIICLIGYLGIDTSGLTALVTSLGVCVGLAVNGTLSNLAGGVLLLITRPFKDDDYIAACGYEGTVEDIKICNTKIRTVDNKVIYIPNGTLSTSTIVNYSEKDLRRLDITFSISYSNDFVEAKKVIEEVYNAHPLVLKTPAPTVRVSEHANSSIDLTAKMWVKNGDYWDVKFDMLEQILKAFEEKKIEIPYNQLDVHVKND